MGSVPSIARYSGLELTGQDNSNIFNVSFDDAPLSLEFTSALFNSDSDNQKQQINLPDDSIIGCIMSDPSLYTLLNSVEDVWMNILIPLFRGSVETRPFYQTLLTEYFKFLLERSKNTFKDEESRRNYLREVINGKCRNLNRLFISQTETCMNIQENEIQQINSTKEFSNLLHNYLNSAKSFKIQQNQIHRLISKRICDILDKSNELSDLDTALEWGFFSGDITPIVKTLRMLMTSHFGNTKSTNFDLSNYEKFYENFSLINAVPNITQNTIDGSKIITNPKISSTLSSSSITCDGNYVYVLIKPTVIEQISLSKSITNDATRFVSKEIQIPKTERFDLGIAHSKDRILMIGPYMSNYIVLKTSPLDEEKNIKKHRIYQPFCCDGYYIYSIRGSKVYIHFYNGNNLELYRKVKLVDSGHELNEKMSKKLIPPLNEISIISNGITFSIIKLISSKQFANKYTYIIRHFSLIDGSHIMDVETVLKLPIISLCVDPWNSCVWGITPLSTTTTNNQQQKSISLIKFQYNGSNPAWLTGLNTDIVVSSKQVSEVFHTKTPVSMSISLINFINYYISHFVGSHLNVGIPSTPDPSCSYPRMFATGAYLTINEILKLIIVLKNMNAEKKYNNQWTRTQYQNAISTLLFLLDFNISNLAINITPPFDEKDEIDPEITSILISLLSENSSFMKQQIIYTISHCFEYIMHANRNNMDVFLLQAFKSLSPQNSIYVLNSFTDTTVLPYCLSQSTCRNFFSPILKRMASLKEDFHRNEFDITTCFMRSLMYELYQTYETNTGAIPPHKMILQENFQSFSGIITEEMLILLGRLGSPSFPQERLRFLPFTRIFSKWLLLLHPFVKFSRVASIILSLIQPLYSFFSKKLTSLKISNPINNNKTAFTYIYALFFDIYSLHVDFITSLVDGGAEIQDIQKYKWLIKSTVASELTPEKVDKLCENFGKPINDESPLLKKGLTLESNTEDSNKFITKMISQDENPSIIKLMDYIYSKVSDPSNKRLSPEKKLFERLIFASLIKHLGFSSITKDLSRQLEKGEKPVLNHAIRQVVLQIYRVRKHLEASRQNWQRLKDEAEQNKIPFKPKSMAEDFPRYTEEMMKKCIFLLYVNQYEKLVNDDNDEIFTQMCKNISDFLTTNVSLSEYFQLLRTAQAIQKNIIAGIGLINAEFAEKDNEICSWFMIQRFSTSNSIVNFLKTLSTKSSQSQGFKTVIEMMDHIRNFILIKSEHFQKSTLLVFLANLLNSIASIDSEQVFDPLNVLINEIIGQKSEFSENQFTSLIAFIISTVIILLETNPNIKKSSQYPKLCQVLAKYKDIAYQRKPIGMLFEQINAFENQDPEEIIKEFSKCDPRDYVSSSQFLLKLIQKSNKKISLLSKMFNEIALVASGQKNIFGSDLPDPDTLIFSDDDPRVKTPQLQLGGCLIFISIIRQLLLKNDQDAIDMINEILVMNHGGQIDKKFMHLNSQLCLYAVFAILSNVIDVFHFGSFMQNESSNSMYLVTDYDKKELSLKGWQTPINGDTKQEEIRPSNIMKVCQLFEFRIEMFPDYKNLLPYFKSSLKQNGRSVSEGLNYYIIACFKEYAQIPDFIARNIPDAFDNLNFKSFNVHSTKESFLNILKIHLVNNEGGFICSKTTAMKFYNTSPFFNHTTKTEEVDHNVLKSKSNFASFVTPPLTNGTTILKIKGIDVHRAEIGLLIPGYKIGCQKTISFRIDSFNIVYTDPKYSFEVDSDDITIAYNASKKMTMIQCNGTSFENDLSEESVPVFYCNIFGEGQIDYSLTNSLYPSEKEETEKHTFNYTTLSYEPVSLGTKDVVLPVSNKLVFSRKKPKLNNIKQIPNTVQTDSDYKPDLKQYFTRSARMHSSLIPTVDTLKKQLIIYDQKSLELASCSLSSTSHAFVGAIKIPIIEFSQKTTIHKYDVQIGSINHILFNKYFQLNNKSFEQKVINEVTGEIVKIKSKAYNTVTSLPLYNPNEFVVMPSVLANYFETALIDEFRSNIYTECYIAQLLNCGNKFIEVNKFFNIETDEDYIMMMVHFLTISEPLNPDIIDFELNLLAKQTVVSSSTDQYTFAARSVFNYYSSTNQISKMIDTMMKIFKDMTNSQNWHYALDTHPDVMFLKSEYNQQSISLNHPWLALLTTGEAYINSNAIKDGTYLIIDENSIKVRILSDASTLVMIPFNDTKNFLGTFVEFAVLFKYLVFLLAENINIAQELRKSVYSLVLDCIMFKSPFFCRNVPKVLDFLQYHLRTICSDLCDDFLVRLNIFSSYYYNSAKNLPDCIGKFLGDHQALWDERVLVPLRAAFPEFLTESDKMSNAKDNIEPSYHLPSNMLVNRPRQLVNIVRRLLQPRKGMVAYPFHLLITSWVEANQQYPNYTLKSLNDNTIVLTFTHYVPVSFKILPLTPNENVKEVMVLNEGGQVDRYPVTEIPTNGKNSLTLKSLSWSWHMIDFTIVTVKYSESADAFIEKQRDKFVTDMIKFALHFDKYVDNQILSLLPQALYQKRTLNINDIVPELFAKARISEDMALIILRTRVMLIVNWLAYTKEITFGKFDSNDYLIDFIAIPLKMIKFWELINSNSVTNVMQIEIDRKQAYELRTNAISNYEVSIIAQLSKYSQVASNRTKERPWRVKFVGEQAIDAGGPSNELFFEAAADFCSPNCGLVIQTPNGRNGIGQFRESVIPFPNTKVKNYSLKYNVAGAIIAMCIRTSVVQDFNFPPLVWEYLTKRKFDIKLLYDIDQNFKVLMDSLSEAAKQNLDQFAFSRQFNLKFVINNITGQECPLVANGRNISVTAENVMKYIVLAKEYRINELTTYLDMIYKGVWQNFNFDPPSFLDAFTLQYAACGESEISAEKFKSILVFLGIHDFQRRWFLNAISRYNTEERIALFKFATGRSRLPIDSSSFTIKVDSSSGKDLMPSASTCFNQLHLPTYTSEEKLYSMVKLAALYSGTMELL